MKLLLQEFIDGIAVRELLCANQFANSRFWQSHFQDREIFTRRDHQFYRQECKSCHNQYCETIYEIYEDDTLAGWDVGWAILPHNIHSLRPLGPYLELYPRCHWMIWKIMNIHGYCLRCAIQDAMRNCNLFSEKFQK